MNINQLQLEYSIFPIMYSLFNLVAYSASTWLIGLHAVVVLAETIRCLRAAVFSKSDFSVKNSCFVLGL